MCRWSASEQKICVFMTKEPPPPPYPQSLPALQRSEVNSTTGSGHAPLTCSYCWEDLVTLPESETSALLWDQIDSQVVSVRSIRTIGHGASSTQTQLQLHKRLRRRNKNPTHWSLIDWNLIADRWLLLILSPGPRNFVPEALIIYFVVLTESQLVSDILVCVCV